MVAHHWEPNIEYCAGTEIAYEGIHYHVLQTHRSQADWAPPIVPALYQRQSVAAAMAEYNHEHPGMHQMPIHQQHQEHQHHSVPMPAPSSEGKTHHSWLNLTPEKKHELEIGGGLVAGLAAIGAGYYAYHKHEENEEKKKAHTYAVSNWLNEGAQRRDDFQQTGPRAPVTWILNEGNHIPGEAIQGGEEDHHPLYICRAYYEGGIHPGKASSNLIKGACYSYGGAELQTSTYEILIGDSRAIRWCRHEGRLTPQMAAQYRAVEGGHEQNGAPLFIAQGRIEGGVHPGKVGVEEGWNGALIPYGGRERQCYEFNLLCYA